MIKSLPPSYTGKKYHLFIAQASVLQLLLLGQLLSTLVFDEIPPTDELRNSTDGNKLVIFFGIALYYGDTYIVLSASNLIGVSLSEPHIDGKAGRFQKCIMVRTSPARRGWSHEVCRASVTARGSRYTARKVLYCQTVSVLVLLL